MEIKLKWSQFNVNTVENHSKINQIWDSIGIHTLVDLILVKLVSGIKKLFFLYAVIIRSYLSKLLCRKWLFLHIFYSGGRGFVRKDLLNSHESKCLPSHVFWSNQSAPTHLLFMRISIVVNSLQKLLWIVTFHRCCDIIPTNGLIYHTKDSALTL